MVFKKTTESLAGLLLGKSVAASMVGFKGELTFKKYRRIRERLKFIRKEFRESAANLTEFHDTCTKFASPVTSPIALISQIQRSGGSFLSQLFDGHPEVHAHPHELKIGYPKKHIWPILEQADRPERWFEFLFEDDVIHHFRNGYNKSDKSTEVFPFIFSAALQKKIFLNSLAAHKGDIKPRAIFDAYMTSYFNAWLNNQNLYGEKKIITAFTPRLAMSEGSMDQFFQTYPDGRLISVVRDPKNWYPSAQRHENKKNKYDDMRRALHQWTESTQAAIRNKEQYGERVCIIKFEDLVSRTEQVMNYLADFLGITFDRLLLTPTFNKMPIEANTSFNVEKPGVMVSALSRYETLTSEELQVLDEVAGSDYQAALRKAMVFT